MHLYTMHLHTMHLHLHTLHLHMYTPCAGTYECMYVCMYEAALQERALTCTPHEGTAWHVSTHCEHTTSAATR